MIKLLSNSDSNENSILSLSLDEIARVGAKKLLAEALQLEVEEYIQKFKDERDAKSGKRLVVKNGLSRERTITDFLLRQGFKTEKREVLKAFVSQVPSKEKGAISFLF